MADRAKEFLRRAAPAVALAGLLSLAAGCASGPKPAPAAVAEPKAQVPAEEIKPLEEKDRPAAQAEETQAAPAPEAAPSPPPAMSEETSQLLAQAAQLGASDPAAALQMVERAAAAQTACAPCFYDKGVLLEKAGRLAEAAEAYRQALNIFAGHRESVINLSNLLLRQGKGNEALALVTRGAKASPQDTALRNQLAKLLIEQGRHQEAAEQAKGVLAVDERNVEAMLYLARVYHLRHKLELAERILLKAKQIDEGDARIFNRLGFVYLDMNDNTSAIASFKKAVDLDPQLAEARNNLGVMFSRAHDYDSAIEQFRQALAADGAFFDAALNLGNALRGAKKFKEAEQAYRQAATLRPSDASVHCNLGLLYLDDEIPDYGKSERFALAVKELEACQQSAGSRLPKIADYREEAAKKHKRALKEEAQKKAREEEKRRQEEQKRREEEQKRAQAEAEAAARAAAEQAAAEKAAQQPPGTKLGGGKDDDQEPAPAVQKTDKPAGSKLGGEDK